MNKIITGSVVGVLGLLLAASSAFAATDISGNGVWSRNKVYSKNTTYLSSKQTNLTSMSTSVKTKTNAGWNKSNFNTGGTSSSTGGDADTTVGVTSLAGGNFDHSDSEACCCDTVPGSNSITDNGAFSHNTIVDSTKCVVKSEQTNITDMTTTVNTNTDIGHNSSSFNTGSGSSATGGDATTDVHVTSVAGINVSM